ncbi:MAG: hypothetical protein HY096_14680 [Nitrospinae bacterium]|nr:hypothetical protein [Nitrospinota bacterium]
MLSQSVSQSVLTTPKKSFLLSIIFTGVFSLTLLTGCGSGGGGGSDNNPTTTTTSGTTIPSSPSLGEAVDNTSLSWTTGGDANWVGQTTVSYFGGSAAQSGAIGDSKTTYIQTIVTNSGTLTFYWKVSSESSYDYLRFYIDGVEQSGKISGNVDWVQKSYSITSGSHTLKWVYTKDINSISGSDAGWLDKVIFTPSSAPTAPTGVTATGSTTTSGTSGGGPATGASGTVGGSTTTAASTTISWNSVSGATSYNIYWSTTSGVTTSNGTKITNATSPYTHTGLTSGTTYYYVVTAVNSSGESSVSSQVSATA